MVPNYLKIIISLCLLVLLNACGIGHYHQLNLVRPDKNTTTALVEPKHKNNKVTETFKADSANIETKEVNALTEFSKNNLSEKTETLTILFHKKPSQNAKKVKLELKEKVLLRMFKNKVTIPKYIINTKQDKKLNKWKPIYNPDDMNFAIFLAILLICSIVIGIFVIPFDIVVGLWMIGIPLSIVLLLAIIALFSN